jgi:DNA-binding transcriptional ArsR family regulator
VSDLQILRRPAQAVALLEPTRRALLEQLAEPSSASQIGRRLGLPRQRLNYHLRELEKEGLVELVEERRKGNCTERIVKATSRSYVISPEALGALGNTPEQAQDRYSASYLIAVAGRAIRDLGRLVAGAKTAGKRLATLTLETEVRFRSAESRNAFAEELATTLAALAAKYHDETAEGGRAFRFFVGGHPVPAPSAGETRPESV